MDVDELLRHRSPEVTEAAEDVASSSNESHTKDDTKTSSLRSELGSEDEGGQLQLTSSEIFSMEVLEELMGVHTYKRESSRKIFLQSVVPFFLGGLGSIFAGLFLSYANKRFQLVREVNEFMTIMPALQGMKGNLDMTFCSRLSTMAHLGDLERRGAKKIILCNIALIQAQAFFLCLLADTIAYVVDRVQNQNADDGLADFIFLGLSAVLAMAVTCGFSTAALSAIILITQRKGYDPDNIVTPLAASFGDLFTVSVMLFMCYLLRPYTSFSLAIPVVLLCLIASTTPCWVMFAWQDKSAAMTAKQQWITLLAAASISCIAGFIQNLASRRFPNYPAYQTLMAGQTGNRCAVHASRISTHLTMSKKSELPWSKRLWPNKYYFSSCRESQTARLLLLTAVPFQLLFLFISYVITRIAGDENEADYRFVIAYALAVFVHMLVMIFATELLVHALWEMGVDPDIHAIPLLTSLADFSGAAALFAMFNLLNGVWKNVVMQRSS